MVKLVALAYLLGGIISIDAVSNRDRRQMTTIGNVAGPVNASTPAPVQGSASSSKEHASKSANTDSSKAYWYGQERDIEEVDGCKWPSDFDRRFSFCANRSSINGTFSIGAVDGAEFGILDKDIAGLLLEKCSSGDCSNAKLNQTHLVDRAELWWHHMDNISDFRKCLKKNSEGMVRLCSADDQVAQTVGGIAGLHLNVMDVLVTIHEKISQSENRTEECLAKLSEAVHFTGAAYLTDRFYSKNTILCWDVTKGTCSPICKQFAYVLTCLQSVCPIAESDLKRFGIWEWYYTNAERSKKVCDVKVDSAQCRSDSATTLSKATPDSPPTGLLGKSKAVFEKATEKFYEFEHTVENYTHMKFFQVALIAGGVLAIFVGAVTTLCMWYHGLVCQRRKRRVLRYSKLVPEDRMGTRQEESKSLTRDYDDVE